MTILALEFSSAQRSVAVVLEPTAFAARKLPSTGPGIPGLSVEERSIRSDEGQGPGELPRDLQEIGGKACRSLAEVIEMSQSRTIKAFSMIASALKQAGIERQQIDCMVVGLGPGSYTGIRASIALAQGWQLGLGVKLLGISSADAIALEAGESGLRGRTNVVIDAQRGEFYVATWDIESEAHRSVEPLRLTSRLEVERRLAAGELVVGPQATSWFPQAKIISPRAATLGRLASGKKDFLPGEMLVPIYLRETQFVKAPPPRVLPF